MKRLKAKINLKISIVTVLLMGAKHGDSHSCDSLDSWLRKHYAASGCTIHSFEVLQSYPQNKFLYKEIGYSLLDIGYSKNGDERCKGKKM